MKRKKKYLIFIIAALLFLLFAGLLRLTAERVPQEAVYKVEDLRGIWLATVYNIDFPGASLSEEDQKADLLQKLDSAKESGLNAVFFQVRPTADALYKSSVYPWSKWLVGAEGGACGYDPLQFLIEEGKTRGIEIHAWINPYRITTGSAESPQHDPAVLAENSPARLHPEWTVNFADGRMYFDPGYPEVTQLIVDGVQEILQNYDIAGIHFDDYFYPSAGGAQFDDSKSFALYGNGRSLEDYRLDNTYAMVKAVSDIINQSGKEVSFGVSPFGVWASKSERMEGSETTGGYSSYTNQYADTRKWAQDGLLDYIAPQLYWSIGAEKTDFSVLLQWWSDTVKDTETQLYIGYAAYKLDSEGADSSWTDASQITDQLKLSRGMGSVSGCIFYNFSCLMENRCGLAEELGDFFTKEGEIENFSVTFPQAGQEIDASNVTIAGIADPKKKLMCNGEEVVVTEDGYFAHFVALQPGQNEFLFLQGGQYHVRAVIRKTLETSPAEAPVKTGMSSVVLTEGDEVTFSCLAPPDATVSVEMGGETLKLEKGTQGEGATLCSFSGVFQASKIAPLGLQRAGQPVYHMERDGEKTEWAGQTELYVYGPKETGAVQIAQDDTGVMKLPSGQSQKLFILQEGATDRVVGETADYYKLAAGGWVDKSRAAYLDEALPEAAVGEITGSMNAFQTTVSFQLPYEAPCKVEVSGSQATVVLCGVQGKEPGELADWNLLFQNITYQQGEDAAYTFALKGYQSFYGYDIRYEDGCLQIVFENPGKAATGKKPLSGRTILLDAGHGGEQLGAVGAGGESGVVEKDINLSVALLTARKLKELGAKVILTRDEDQLVTLDERRELIRKAGADISLSIHHNSVAIGENGVNREGILTLYTSDFSEKLAQSIQNAVVREEGRVSEGTRVQSLAVCRLTECPSVLVELGYLCNPSEYGYLMKEDTMEREAEALAAGVLEYFQQ